MDLGRKGDKRKQDSKKGTIEDGVGEVELDEGSSEARDTGC